MILYEEWDKQIPVVLCTTGLSEEQLKGDLGIEKVAVLKFTTCRLESIC